MTTLARTYSGEICPLLPRPHQQGICRCGATTSRPGRCCRSCANQRPWTKAQHERIAQLWSDDARRAESAERTRQQWASRPRKASGEGHPLPTRTDYWTAHEDHLLRELAGTMPLPELAAAISASGLSRTANAVACRAYRLGVSISAAGTAASGLCGIFCASPSTVDAWIKRGFITGKRSGAGPRSAWLFSDNDILVFLRGHPLAYDLSRIKHRRFRAEAEVVARTHGWIPAATAAEFLRMPLQAFHRYLIRSGRLVSRAGPHPTRRWQTWVQRSDVMELGAAVVLPRLRRKHRDFPAADRSRFLGPAGAAAEGGDGMSEQAGHVNAYTCTACGGRITTINLDAGTTPMFLNCRAKPGCRGTMQSHGYRIDQSTKPSHEFFRPSLREARRQGAAMAEHVARGGPDLRVVGEGV